MSAEILSLDLDWFNLYKTSNERKDGIYNFFRQLKTECVLPKVIDFVPEHHYLYPWSMKILDKLNYRKINVINIDEHHDFYCIDEIDFDDEKAVVGCWNFFAFMAHRRMLGKYYWITNENKRDAQTKRECLFDDLLFADSLHVQNYRKHITVFSANEVFQSVRKRKFDGFIIVRSPTYTANRRSVYRYVDQALKSELPKCRIRRYQCRAMFVNNLVHHHAEKLFWKV